jgi:adenylate kinase
MTYNIILLGPPGTGKGTQAERLSERLNVPHISTGEMFRQLATEGDSLGIKARDIYWGKGNLVPDDITIGLVEKRLNKTDCGEGFILDGFPRTIPQAEALEKLLKSMNKSLNYVVEIQSSEEIIVKRLSARRQCRTCKKIYGLDVPSKEEGKCDVDDGELFQRSDDNEEVIRDRLQVYKTQTEPLIQFYKMKGKLKSVNGEEPIDVILDNITNIVKN